MGCGTCGQLVRFVSYGVDPARAHGVDLLEDRIRLGRSRLPSADLRVGNAARLPYADRCMDIVMQFTMISSILHAGMRAEVTTEMSRVVKPSGVIVSCDFWINPVNRDVRGLTRRELRSLLPAHRIDARSINLAPPIARVVASRSYRMAAILQALPPLRTHVLAFITPPATSAETQAGLYTARRSPPSGQACALTLASRESAKDGRQWPIARSPETSAR